MNRTISSKAKAWLPDDVVSLLRRRFGTARPWDPGARLDPPAPKRGERVGPPSFVGVGTQKSGTSWWYEVIAAHGDVHDVAGAHKERHFFTRYFGEEFTDADTEAYHRWFPRPHDRLVGEWTPQYMHQPWVPPLLARAAPAAKILVLLRDPVERYRSGLTHYAARGREVDSPLAIDAMSRGMYADQLEYLLRSFPTEQILVLQYETCCAEPVAMARRTFEFLGIDPDQPVGGLDAGVNTTKVTKVAVPDHLRRTLVDLYTPDVARLAGLVDDFDLDLWPNFARTT